MARRRNTDHYEELAPTLVVPDHFSSNQSSTIVIIYGEEVGEPNDELSFIFPGEISGGNLKKVYPRQVDSNTFVIETPTYSVLRRGFVHVTPQLRLSTGETIEMSDFKISLKHPVRNVMELCLNLSTQSAVLPVLLTLLIHSKQNSNDSSKDKYFIKDPHFDRIMATLVGSMDPGTRCVKDVILPDKKWKKMNLTEFARDFEMQEMEKQAYMLAKRAKDKKKGKQQNVSKQDQDDTTSICMPHSDYEDVDHDLIPPPIPLFRNHLSSSTPEINHLSVSMGGELHFPDPEPPSFSGGGTPNRRRKKLTKTLPAVPKKKGNTQEDVWPNALPRSASDAPAPFSDAMYDAVKFDIEDEPTSPARRNTGKSPAKKLPVLPKLKSPITVGFSSPQTQRRGTKVKSDEEEDRLSLDSYEEMNEVPGLAEQRESWLNAQYQPPGEVLPPQPLPHGEKYPDPTNRAKMPLPPSPPSSHQPTPIIHYTLSTKQKKKLQQQQQKPLPPEPVCPPEPACPPPPSKPPFPEPKPANLKSKPKQRKPVKKQFSRRRKDVYIPDSESDEAAEDPAPLLAPPAPSEAKKRPYINLNISSTGPELTPRPGSEVKVQPEFDDEHLYDSAEVPEEAKRRARKTLLRKDLIATETPPPTTPPPPPRVKSQYQNVEPPYDQNPSLPPRAHPSPPYEDAPLLPPRSKPLSTAHQENEMRTQPKKIPHTPPTKPKIPPTPPAKTAFSPPRGNFTGPPNVAAKPSTKKPVPPPVLNKPDKNPQDELSEQLSSMFANRSVRPGSSGAPLLPPAAGGHKKPQHWKRGEPHLPPGPMTNFI